MSVVLDGSAIMDDVCRISTTYSGSILITVWLVYCLWNVVYHNDTMRPLPPCTVAFPNRRFSPTGGFPQPEVFPGQRFFPAGGISRPAVLPAGRNLGAAGILEQRNPWRTKGSRQGPGDRPSFLLVGRRPTIGPLVAQRPIIGGPPRPRVRAASR